MEQVAKMEENYEREDTRILNQIRRTREKYKDKSPEGFLDATLQDKLAHSSLKSLEENIQKLTHHIRLLNEDIADIDKERRLSMSAQKEIKTRIAALYVKAYPLFDGTREQFEVFLVKGVIPIQHEYGNNKDNLNWTHILFKNGVPAVTVHAIDNLIGPEAASVRIDHSEFYNRMRDWRHPENKLYRETIKERKFQGITGYAGGR